MTITVKYTPKIWWFLIKIVCIEQTWIKIQRMCHNDKHTCSTKWTRRQARTSTDHLYQSDRKTTSIFIAFGPTFLPTLRQPTIFLHKLIIFNTEHLFITSQFIAPKFIIRSSEVAHNAWNYYVFFVCVYYNSHPVKCITSMSNSAKHRRSKESWLYLVRDCDTSQVVLLILQVCRILCRVFCFCLSLKIR